MVGASDGIKNSSVFNGSRGPARLNLGPANGLTVQRSWNIVFWLPFTNKVLVGRSSIAVMLSQECLGRTNVILTRRSSGPSLMESRSMSGLALMESIHN